MHSPAWRGFFYFNSRPSARGDDAHGTPITPTVNFNSRPSARGDECMKTRFWLRKPFQFTPLREGRLLAKGEKQTYTIISIHAPPRGATFPLVGAVRTKRKFQFTPLREGRPAQTGKELMDRVFQFTPLREGRRNILSAYRTS